MEFCFDVDSPNHVWIDQGMDECVDHFQPCGACMAVMRLESPPQGQMGEVDLCHECNVRLMLESAVTHVKDERPYRYESVMGQRVHPLE